MYRPGRSGARCHERLREQGWIGPVEIVSPVFKHAAEACLLMGELRRALAAVAAEHDLRLAAGTHPLGVWHEQRVTDRPRYERLMNDFRIIGHRNLVCGLHVHVAVPEGVDRIDVMNRALRWLPLFLALSTASPFWNGRTTGLLSCGAGRGSQWQAGLWAVEAVAAWLERKRRRSMTTAA